MGVFSQAGELHEVGTLREELGLLPRYIRLFDALLDMLQRAGWLELSEGQATVRELPDAELLSPEAGLAAKEELRQQHPDLSPHAELLWTCVEAIPEVLTGQVPATEILFPESSKGQVEAIYKGNAFADALNDLVSRGLRLYLERRAAEVGAPLRILEVGAGTGGTTERVLPAIAASGVDVVYTYTDISVGFLTYGDGKFKASFPFTEFQRLDIERDVEAQGFAVGGYDVVIATNVLHATKRIGNTLSHVRTLLVEGGRVILNESTTVNDFTTLTFGLLDGWWAFEDGEERLPHSPLLSAEMWAEQLRQSGFIEPLTLGPGGRVIIASRGGNP
jgi:SAM-dependent methyltransferase